MIIYGSSGVTGFGGRVVSGALLVVVVTGGVVWGVVVTGGVVWGVVVSGGVVGDVVVSGGGVWGVVVSEGESGFVVVSGGGVWGSLLSPDSDSLICGGVPLCELSDAVTDTSGTDEGVPVLSHPHSNTEISTEAAVKSGSILLFLFFKTATSFHC